MMLQRTHLRNVEESSKELVLCSRRDGGSTILIFRTFGRKICKFDLHFLDGLKSPVKRDYSSKEPSFFPLSSRYSRNVSQSHR